MGSHSTREVAQKLGYKMDSGGTNASLKRMYEELGIDTSHFHGKAWNKGRRAYDLLDNDVSNYKIRNDTLKRYLLEDRGLKCEK